MVDSTPAEPGSADTPDLNDDRLAALGMTPPPAPPLHDTDAEADPEGESAPGSEWAPVSEPAPADDAAEAAEPVQGETAPRDESASTDEPAPNVEPASTDESAAADEPSPAAESANPSPLPAVITKTTLVFLAPELPPLPDRPTRGERRDHEDEDEPRNRRGRRGRDRNRDTRESEGPDRDEERDGDRGALDEQPSGGSRRRNRRGGRSQDELDEHEQAAEVITEPQKIKGSTRLEAKRQRRREGRETGRRREVITESEFLARREGVERTMLVRGKDGRVQIGVLEDKVLVEHYVARAEEASLIGNVYLGRVQNVLPSMEAAFIDIGRGRNAVLYSGEVDWAAAELRGSQARRIENALKPGDRVLVQVTKDPVGHKGARLTSQVSLPGRYLVYVPGNSMNGISRKLPDTERARLKKILKVVLPAGAGVIVRTAAEGATQEQLERDVNRLVGQWAALSAKIEQGNAPQMLHSEPDLLVKIIRDVFNEDFGRIIIQGAQELETISEYLQAVAPDLVDKIEPFHGDDVFTEHRAHEQIEKALDRKVWLPSGGSLVIDRTEAMTVVDVNTGKFVGSGGNLEETVTKNNLEAAEEVVRQLRLRDIGGIIVVDFIDMVLESNRDLVLRRLMECLSRDRTRHQVAEVTSLGLVQMTRKKLGLGLLETFSEPCEICAGRGVVVQHEPVMKKAGAGESDNGRGGKRGRKGGQQQTASKAQTHAVTDDARNALSKIAASTIANGRATEAVDTPPLTADAPEERESGQTPQTPRSEADDEAGSGSGSRRRSRRGRRGRSGDSGQDVAPRGEDGRSSEQPAPRDRDRSEAEPASSGAGTASAALAADLAALDASAAQPDRVTAEAAPTSPATTPDLRLLDQALDGLVSSAGESQTSENAAENNSAESPVQAPAAAESSEPSGTRRRGGRRRITTDTISTE